MTARHPLLFILLAAGCQRAGAEPAPPFTLKTMTGRAIELRQGKAYLTDDATALEIRLTDVAAPCGSGFRPPWSAAAYITVPPGPGGRWFAGAPFGTKVSGGDTGQGGMFSSYSAASSRVTLEPFSARAGAKVRGELTLLTGGEGAFEAELCPGDYTRAAALPAEAPAGTLAGTLAGKPFAGRRALATLSVHSAGYRELGVLAIFDGKASCADLRNGKGPPMLWLDDLGGASSAVTLIGTAQPASFQVRPAGAASLAMPKGGAWIEFTELRLEAGARVTGRLVVRTRPGETPAVDAGGSFSAEICPPG